MQNFIQINIEHKIKDNTFRLSSADLSACLKVANLVRNICAHDERLYNVNLRNVRISQIANHFGIRRYDNKRFYSGYSIFKNCT